MNRDRKILAGILCLAFVLSSAPPLFSQQKPRRAEGEVMIDSQQKPRRAEGDVIIDSQQKQPRVEGDVMIYRREKMEQDPEAGRRLNPPSLDDAFWFVTSEMSFEGKLVKSAPYSAQAVTEMTQTLSDGNRIVNKSTVSIYRDSEGRTRREQALRAIGPFASGNDTPQTIFISDPVAGVSYVLDVGTHTARKTLPQRFEFKIKTAVEGVKTEPGEGVAPQAAAEVAATEAAKRKEGVHVFVEPAGPRPEVGILANKVAGGDVVMTAPRVAGGAQFGWAMEVHGNGQKDAKSESLGKQSIEGVEAEGSRTTVTIPAGDIGNERPIEVVSERWYSAELQTIVMTRHSDPRFGETVYRLTNINRSEPAKSLFEVPADYTIKEKPEPGFGPQMMRKRKPIDEQ